MTDSFFVFHVINRLFSNNIVRKGMTFPTYMFGRFEICEEGSRWHRDALFNFEFNSIILVVKCGNRRKQNIYEPKIVAKLGGGMLNNVG